MLTEQHIHAHIAPQIEQILDSLPKDGATLEDLLTVFGHGYHPKEAMGQGPNNLLHQSLLEPMLLCKNLSGATLDDRYTIIYEVLKAVYDFLQKQQGVDLHNVDKDIREHSPYSFTKTDKNSLLEQASDYISMTAKPTFREGAIELVLAAKSMKYSDFYTLIAMRKQVDGSLWEVLSNPLILFAGSMGFLLGLVLTFILNHSPTMLTAGALAGGIVGMLFPIIPMTLFYKVVKSLGK